MLIFRCLPCLFCFFYCSFRGLNLYSWDITWYPTTGNLWSVNQKHCGLNLYSWDITSYPTTGNLWSVNQKPTRMRGSTVPDYIVIYDMLIFCCLPCLFCCFYCYFCWLNLYSWDITWCPTARNLWSLNQFSLTILFCCFYCYFCWLNLCSRDITWYPATENLWSVNQKPMRLRGTTVPDYIVIDDMLIFCCWPCLFCCFDCYFRWLSLYSWDITWHPTTGSLWSVNQKLTRLRWTAVPDYIFTDDMLFFSV